MTIKKATEIVNSRSEWELKNKIEKLSYNEYFDFCELIDDWGTDVVNALDDYNYYVAYNLLDEYLRKDILKDLKKKEGFFYDK